jgi:aryl-alcohol dehydrogenase-like predicted oxidoreductase
MTISRRSALKLAAAAGAGLLLHRVPLLAELAREPLIRRAVPRTGEMLPVVGLGGLSFMMAPGSPNYERGQEAIRTFHSLGGRVIDTAPGYRASERFIGETLRGAGITDEVFLATKFNALQILAGNTVRASGGEAADKAVMQRQLEESLQRLGRRRLDLQQVWNLGDIQSNAARSTVPAGYLQWHIDKALEWKRAGLTRYVGITTSREAQYGEFEQAMSRHPIDFVQLDYSIDNPGAGERLIPAARDNGVAVLVNRPFGSGALFRQARDRGKTLPPWAAEYGIDTWAKYFLKFILSHDTVTAVIPASGNPANVRDNLGAGTGAIPDAATRRRMLAYWRA